MSIFATIDHVYALGEADGRQRGSDEGACQQTGKLLLRHGNRQFGPPTAEERAFLDRLIDAADRRQLERLQDQFLDATSWTALLAHADNPKGPVSDPDYLLPVDLDLSPPTASVDEYLRVQMLTGEPQVIHLRFQKIYQPEIGAILYKQNRLLRAKYNCPVKTLVIVLWPGADGPAMSGAYRTPEGAVFRWLPTRLWEKDVEETFNSFATCVFAPLARFAPERLPEIIRRMDELVESGARTEEDRENCWFMAYSSMGLRYSVEQVNALLAHRLDYLYQTEQCRRIRSDGFYAGRSAGLEEGRLQATIRWVLELGRRRLGEPPAPVAAALPTLRSQDRLEQLVARALKSANWQDLMKPG